MYEIIRFMGGIYRFDELYEYVEDLGGLVLSRDNFDIIRGDSFLSTEVHVLLMVPENEIESLESIINEIKGMHDHIEITDEQRIHFYSYLSVYDALARNPWCEKEILKDILICPCNAMLCKISGDNECILLDKLDEILEDMQYYEIIELKIIEEKILYKIKEK